MRRVALRTTLGTPLIRYAQGSGGVEPNMNLTNQVNKFNDRALRARQSGDHALADYFEQLRDHMLAEAEQGRPRPFSHYLPQAQEEFGDHIAGRAEDVVRQLQQRAEQHGVWYHASPHDLKPGTMLTPGGADAASKDFYDQGFGDDRGTLMDMGGGRREHVWLSPHMEDAKFWSTVNRAPHIYETIPFEEPQPWNGTGTDGWVTPSAFVVRKMTGARMANVVLYTKPGCVQCDATHRHLTRSGVPFESVDVTQSPQALEHARSLGYSSAPVVITQNDHWSGYRPDKLNTLKTAAEWTDEDRERDLHRLMEKSHEERQQRFNNPTKIYRGLKLDLPPELEEHIKANSRMPMEPEEVGQHLSIGPKLLDHLQTAHPLRTNEYVPEPDIGLGRHWTTNKRFADIAAMQGGPYGSRHSVVLEADFPGHEHVDPEHPYVGGSWQDMSGNPMVPWKEEEEYTLKPGTPLNITGVNLNGNEVLHDPHYEKSMPKDYGIPYNGGPQIRQAGRPYTDEEWAQHKQQGWRGPPCEDPSHQGQVMGRCAECGRRVAPEQRVAKKWDEPGSKCKYCKSPPTYAILHSEGMAYVQTCDKHLDKGKKAAEGCVPFGPPDPGNINKVKKLAYIDEAPWYNMAWDDDLDDDDEPVLPPKEHHGR